jgi:hypothetical protein
MGLIVQTVPLQYFHQTWPLVEKYIEDALQWGGDDYTLEQVKALIASGTWILIVAADEQKSIHGASAINLFNMPNDRIAFVTAIGGKLISNKDTFAQFSALLKSYGATKIQGAARESIARLWTRYGFKERYRIVETKL